MELIIHIGYHKTGSTAIQKFMEANRDELAERRIIYPKGLSQWPGHPELSWIFSSTRLSWQDRDYNRAEVEGHYREYFDRYAETDVTLILSSEEFCRLEFDLRSMWSLQTFISKYHPVIFGYIRDPLFFLLSRYRHEVQNGAETRSLMQFVTAYENLQSASFGHRSEKWEQAFPNRCIFRDYDQESKKNKSIVPDFFHALGRDHDIEYLLPSTEVEFKLHPLLLEARRLVNAYGLSKEQHASLARAIFDLSGQLPSAGLQELAAVVPPQLLEVLRSMYGAWPDTSRTIISLREGS